jgi:hypothetical protein
MISGLLYEKWISLVLFEINNLLLHELVSKLIAVSN